MQTKNLGNVIFPAAIACLLIWNVAGAGPTPIPEPLAQPAAGSISVSGSSAIRVQPDRVVVIFGVETFARTPRASQAQNARLSREVLAAIRAHSIAERDIATAHFTLQPRYDDYDRNIISGYEARNTIAVTLRDAQKLEPVLVAALEAGATAVDGIEFSITNLRELRDEARELAIQAALEKATAMSAAAGMTLGDVTNIREEAGYYGYFGSWRGDRQWTNVQNVVQDLADEGALTLEDGSISLGQIVVKAQVSLTAELVPIARPVGF
ncbi:MAG: SIMPL domain-containing protein [Chloroflexi bacterium]|nr:SIMPL domain-containing protein [Chloroflexota bacterium]